MIIYIKNRFYSKRLSKLHTEVNFTTYILYFMNLILKMYSFDIFLKNKPYTTHV